jgi:small subunit ribosomal protein S6
MRHYEMIYIMNPDLAEEDCRGIIEKFKNFIEDQKGVIIKTQEWGKQTLAYLINKFDKGYYVLVEFCAEQALIAGLERNLKLDDRILKYQTIKLAEKADPEELLKKQPDESKEKVVQEDTKIQALTSTDKNNESGNDSEVKNGD